MSMGYYKNIKRNSTRPIVSKRPYVQSMHGVQESKKETARRKLIEQELNKLESWKKLCGKQNKT